MIAAILHVWPFCSEFVFISEAVSPTIKEEAISKSRPGVGDDPAEEVELVYVREPTREQAELARTLRLPLTFFCYKNEPGYISDDDEDGTSS